MPFCARPALFCALFAVAAAGQTQQPPTEMAQHDEPATFKTHVNLVMVPVVVRDKSGKAVGTLKKEDFQLFDKGKPQDINRFSVEKPGEHGDEVKTADNNTGEGKPTPVDIPDRFVAYVFDDIHINFGDLARTRQSAIRSMANLRPTDRAAIFTTSGQVTLEFTDDRNKFNETLLRLMPHPIARSTTQECPDISYYMADLITNKNDPQAMQAAAAETVICMNLQDPSQAPMIVRGISQRVLGTGEHEKAVSPSPSCARSFIAWPSAPPRPASRLCSLRRGFSLSNSSRKEPRCDRSRHQGQRHYRYARRARPLYGFLARPQPPLHRFHRHPHQIPNRALLPREPRPSPTFWTNLPPAPRALFIENNNDFDERPPAHRRGRPPSSTCSAFHPRISKLTTAAITTSKVSLKLSAGLSLVARRGYFAPKRLESAEETAKQEIEEALFSREELQDLPMEMHTQFFKTGDTAKLNVLVHLSMKRLRILSGPGDPTQQERADNSGRPVRPQR